MRPRVRGGPSRQRAESPGIWGWRRKPTSQGWAPQGARIGWVTGSDLFLEPAVSYQIVHLKATELAEGRALPIKSESSGFSGTGLARLPPPDRDST
jgi:hypothetical protein